MRTKYKIGLLLILLAAIAVLFINRGRAYSLFFSDEMPAEVDTQPKPLEVPADATKSTPPPSAP